MPLFPLLASQPMSQFAHKLNRHRERLDMTVPEVHRALLALGVDVAESTVYGWFNGSRGVRKMEHLRALCTVLQTDLNELTSDDIAVTQGPLPATIAREAAMLAPAQQELVLALVRSLSGKPAPAES